MTTFLLVMVVVLVDLLLAVEAVASRAALARRAATYGAAWRGRPTPVAGGLS